MPPRSSQCSTVCPLQQLKAIQNRTEVNKQYLIAPDLRPFLTTNDPLDPGSITYSLAHTGYLYSRVDLWKLDRIVRDIQALLDSTKETRDQIVAYKSQFNFVSHPVRSLPDDILLLIFEQCILIHWHEVKVNSRYGGFREDGSRMGEGSLHNGYPPWQLSHVCRRWRRLVLASPSLWSIVHVPSPPFSTHDEIQTEDPIASRIDLYLKRSRNSLLDVRIGSDGQCYSDVLRDNGKVVSLLRATTNRGHTLRMNVGPLDEGYNDDAVFLGCSFPNLARIEVKDSEGLIDPNIQVVLTTFQNSPNLIHVRAYGIKVDINWNKIISYRSCAPFLAAHSLLPSLQRLIIDGQTPGCYKSPDFVDELPSLSLPVLHTLRIKLLDLDDIRIFDYLLMPHLDTLQMELPYWGSDPVRYPELRRWDRLRNLSLRFNQKPEDEQPLVSFLASAPRVVALHLLDDTLLKTTILRMTGTDDVFPCLESLGLEASILQNSSKTYGEVQAIIESRLNVPVPKIRELKVNLESVRYYFLTRAKWEGTFERVRSLGVKVISGDIKNF